MLKIVEHKKIYLTIAAVLVVASIASLLIQGFALDTDFAGGTSISYTFSKDVNESEVEAIAEKAFGKKPSMVRKTDNVIDIEVGHDTKLSDDENVKNANGAVEALTYELAQKWGKITPVVDKNGAAVTSSTKAAAGAEWFKEGDTKTAITSDQINKQVINHDGYKYFVDGVSKSELNVVSPSTARSLAKSAILMSILAALAILIYVWIRFELTSGVCAVVALAHDVLVLCGIYSILRIKIDTNFIAAVLTVLGYSINNTIVIFDRIRENTRQASKNVSYGQIANTSINQTLKRSINTTITTLLTIGMVYVLGVASIKEFALPIIIGIIVGTYSSIFVSGSIWSIWRDDAVKNKKAKAKAK